MLRTSGGCCVLLCFLCVRLSTYLPSLSGQVWARQRVIFKRKSRLPLHDPYRVHFSLREATAVATTTTTSYQSIPEMRFLQEALTVLTGWPCEAIQFDKEAKKVLHMASGSESMGTQFALQLVWCEPCVCMGVHCEFGETHHRLPARSSTVVSG